MEVLIFLILFVVLFVVFAIKSSLNSNLSRLEQKIDSLAEQLKKVNQQEQVHTMPWKHRDEAVAHRATPAPAPEKPIEEPKAPKLPTPEPKPVLQPEPETAFSVPKTAVPIVNIEAEKIPEPKTSFIQNADPKPGFFERNPDLEKFIGENLANKIGIAILVLGIGFFVKYAIDQNWINEIGRVFIGILCGGILLGVAHKLRKTFTAFSSVLVGGGIAVLYFTIAIAFHEYQIFSQTVAFVIMVIITAFTIFLSLGYNRVELAVLAILGGFGSPFMVSTGEGNYIVLFTYMMILNSGMLVLAYHKKWRIINIICYIFTIIIYGGWLSSKFDSDNTSMIIGALIFATLFYLIFFAMNIINNLKERTTFEALEIMMLLSNTFLFYAAGMRILGGEVANQFQGLFTASLGIFNFIFAYSLYKNKSVDRNLVFLLIGLVLTFISLAAPIQLEGNYITLFWAAEAVLLLWLGQKSGIDLIKIASVVVMGLMCISLAMDYKQIYFDGTDELIVILNKGYITSIVAVASLILTSIFLRKVSAIPFINISEYRTAITFIACIVLYAANFLELSYHLVVYIDSYATRTIIIGTYNMLFILILLLSERRLTLPEGLKTLFPAWSLVVMGAYLFYYHGYVISTRDEFLHGISYFGGFLCHYLLLALVLTNVILCLRSLNKQPKFTESISNAHWWVFIIFFIFLGSSELDHTVLLLAFTDVNSADHIILQNHKIGFPILWGISSFLLIAIGLQKKIKTLRIISLVLLLFTLLKLFLVDLRGISEGGKIAAFISLGVLLLVVSFMYQRLKKILLEDSPVEQTENIK
jgi:uncharacterized membrane protein